MTVTERAFRRLFYSGHATKLPGTIGLVVKAITMSFDRLRAFYLQIPSEAVPKTAVLTIPAWYQALGLPYDPTTGLSDLQARADAAWSQTGGQSLNYLNGQIQKELPQVYIQEVLFPGGPPANQQAIDARVGLGHVGAMRVSASDAGMSYLVIGTVPDRPKYNRLQAIIARIGPLNLWPAFIIQITSELGAARTGVGHVGNARIGKGS